MPARLGEDRAQIILNAVHNDPTFFLSDSWCDEHNVTKEEVETFLEYGLLLARMYEWRELNMDVGSVEVLLTFTTHSGKVGSDEEKWTCFAPQADTARILRVAESGKVIAQLSPEQMPLPLDGVGMVDLETGEVFSG